MSALEDPRPSPAAEALLSGIGDSRFALATVHRRENRGTALEGVARGISKVAHAHALPVILPLHPAPDLQPLADRSEEHTSELQSLMRISYAVFCLKKKKNITYRVVTVN